MGPLLFGFKQGAPLAEAMAVKVLHCLNFSMSFSASLLSVVNVCNAMQRYAISEWNNS